MKVSRILVDAPLVAGSSLDLPVAAAHHVGNVLRLKAGQELELFDGAGGAYRAEIELVDRARVRVRLLAVAAHDTDSLLRLTLIQGISRGPHMDYTIQKVVELGVQRICPVFTGFGNVRLDGQRATRKLQHWRNIVIAACEQCGRNRLPEILPPMTLAERLAGDLPPVRLVFDADAGRGLRTIDPVDADIALLVGPEGGLAGEELTAAAARGFAVIRLGPRMLRTETAAVAAVAACQVLWGDL